MDDTDGTPYESPQFSAIRGALKWKRLAINGPALGIIVLGAWVAYRTGFVDLYPISLLLGGFTYFVMRVAIDLVELVSETLMPR